MADLVLGVVGPGPANADNIQDLLSDWLGYGEPDQEGYLTRTAAQARETALVLPLTDEHYTPGVAMARAWSARADIEYTGVIDPSTPPARREVKGAKGEACDLLPAEDVLGGVLDVLAEAGERGAQACLLILQDPADPDKATEQLVADAASLGIEVRNLSFGLEPVAAPLPEPSVAPEVGYDSQSAAALDRAPDPEIAGQIDGVFFVLDNLLAFHNAGDTMARLHATGQMSGQASALTADLLRVILTLRQLLRPEDTGPLTPRGHQQLAAEDLPGAAEELLDPDSFEDLNVAVARALSAAEAQEAVDAQPVGGPVTKVKTRREWYDEESGTWRPVGRGRPRKDVQTREVPVAA